MNYLTDKLTRKEHALLTNEQKKARRKALKIVSNKAYRANPNNKAKKLTPKQKARKRELQKLRSNTLEGKAKRSSPEYRNRQKVYRDAKRTHFVAYKHTNSKGQIYLGAGTNLRPYLLNDSLRTPNWISTYSNDIICIDVLDTFDTKKEARKAERALIAKIGLSNLVNVNH